jgi:hypothetical protein
MCSRAAARAMAFSSITATNRRRVIGSSFMRTALSRLAMPKCDGSFAFQRFAGLLFKGKMIEKPLCLVLVNASGTANSKRDKQETNG